MLRWWFGFASKWRVVLVLLLMFEKGCVLKLRNCGHCKGGGAKRPARCASEGGAQRHSHQSQSHERVP